MDSWVHGFVGRVGWAGERLGWVGLVRGFVGSWVALGFVWVSFPQAGECMMRFLLVFLRKLNCTFPPLPRGVAGT